MKSRHQSVVLITLAALTIWHTDPATGLATEPSFSQDVRPILAEYCLHCHGPDQAERQADLRLDVAETGNDSAIVAGRPDQSEVIKRILSRDPDQQMPPPEMERRPTAEEIETLRQWIKSGAQFEGHWAYQPTMRPKPPGTPLPEPESAAPETSQPPMPGAGDIDRFILSELADKGLQLSPRVNRSQLIRRATFDLLGLPPTSDEVDAFVNDPSNDAFAQVVDRLLESPRYGERWGRHWLDLARYADTHGGTAIGFTRFPFSYTYRDYVIKAFNDDLPYDQFIVQQLAADQLGLKENDPALAALGFLTVGMQFRSVHDRIDDQIDVITRGLMGMTVACARCHDHKFDAIPTSDYYAMYATLASSESPDMLPTVGHPEPSEALRDYQTQLDHRQTLYRDMQRDQAEVMRGRLRNQVGMYLAELAKGTPEQDVSAAILSYRTDDVRPLVLNRWRQYMQDQSPDDPVFGFWVRLRNRMSEQPLEPESFSAETERIVQSFKDENGDPKQFADAHRLSVEAPKWNPRVIDAIEKFKPKSMVELAQAYGQVFAEVHQTWLRALLNASLEALPGAEILTDEDPRHVEINSAIDQQIRRHLYEPGTPTAVNDDIATGMLNRTVNDNLGGRRGAIQALHLNSPGSPPRAMVLREQPNPPLFHVFRRGNPLSRGEPVSAHFLTAVSSGDEQPFVDGQRRLGLAQAIVAAENPLTRRVIVNWIWRHHFGLGLVRTPDDLGTRGTPPTHPELLDYLASSFTDDGWSIKQVHRKIMLSNVYQQAAVENPQAREIDPENQTLWRMPRRRLEMEAMRDALLAVSGELDLSVVGGPPFDFDSDPIVPRRSVFGFINRDIISNLASTFDGADPTACTVKRPMTTVPQQTLYALNSEFIQDRAAAVAALAKQSSDRDAERVRWLYRRLFSRPPNDDEIAQAVEYVVRSYQDRASVEGHADPWTQLAHAMLAANEFVFLD